MIGSRSLVILAAVWVTVAASGIPVRRSPDLEARRRSAIDRGMIRFGRSYPPEPSAADLREIFERPTRRGNSFLRFGRSQPLALSTHDLISLLRAYQEDYDVPDKKSASFVRFGRSPAFIRFGRSAEDQSTGSEQTSQLVVSRSYPQRKNRARNHFIRLGRDNANGIDEDQHRRVLYDEDYEVPDKKSASFVRFGRTPSDEQLLEDGNESNTIENYSRKEMDPDDAQRRKKRSTEFCHNCQS